MADIKLITRQVGPWGMNTYALICPRTNASVLIDPGDDPEILLEMLVNSTPVAILLTHSHGDHIGALTEMRQKLGVPLVTFPGPHAGGLNLKEDRHLQDGDYFHLGDYRLKVYHTPGHIEDQICFAIEDDDRIIVGDTVFEGGPGKTWSEDGFQTTLTTIKNVVLKWPDQSICYSGHGPSFVLGDKRKDIKNFLDKDHGNFFGDATWDM